MAKEKKVEVSKNEIANKLQALEVAKAKIEKDYGKGAIMRLGDAPERDTAIGFIPSGSIVLDEALGIGGYPRGRIIEVFGHESTGKTTLALHAIAEAQKAGGLAAFIDAEHALDVNYAKRIGVATDELWLSQPDSGEQALEIVETLVRTGSVDIIVVDSVAALTPKSEIDGDMGDSHVGLQARLMSQALRKLTGILSKSNTTIIFINQIRMKIGVLYGSPETTTGGNALKFYSSIRLEVRKGDIIGKNAENVTGFKIRVKVVKNKVAPPFKKVEMDLLFSEGLSYIGGLLDVAISEEIIEKSGSWYSYMDEKIGQGRENSINFLKENKEILEEVDKKVRENLFKKSI